MNQRNNSMFHQVNGVVGDLNNSTMNLESLDNFMFQQGNGISNNGTMNLENFMFLQGNGDHHSRIPETPERQYIQRQGYQNSNWEGSVNPVFSPDASVMQRSNPSQNLSSEMQMNQIPFDIGHLTEESVYQMWAQIQRNHQIVQSANPQVQPRNNHGVLLDPKPSEMTLNQIGNGWQQSNPLPSRQISQTPDSVSTQMEGNQEHNSDWLETIGLYTSILHNSSTRLVNDGRNVGIGNVQGSFGDVDQYLGVSSTGLLPESNSSYSYNGNNRGQQNCANSNQWKQEHVSGLTLNQTTMLPAANSSWGQQNCDNSNVWQQEHASGLTLNQTTKLPAANCSWGQQNCDNSNVWQEEHFSGLTLNQTTKLPAANCSWGQQNCANPNQWQQEQASGLTLNQTTMIPSANGSYSEIRNKWGQQNCANPNQWQQEHVSGLNQTTRGSTSLEKNLSDGFHIPFQPLYNNATPSHVGYGGSSSTTTTVYYNNAPVTPAKDYHQSSLSHISHALESWNPEKHKQHHTGPTSTNQPSTVVIASPSNSTSLKEKVSEDNACVVTDSNKTPELKTPKRKKHRPKVVVEGKPKRTPKSAPPKTEVVAGEKSTGKRKYVRRKGVETSTPKNNEKNEFEGGSKSGSATRPCRRKLKFDSEQEINDSLNLSGSRLELSSQETTSSNDLNSVHVVPSTNIAQQNTDGAANQRIANEVPQCDLKAQARTQVAHVVLNRVCVQKEQMPFQELARVTYKIETQQLFSQSGIHPINDCQEIKEKTGEKRDNRDISNLGADKRTRLDESRRVLSNVPSVTSAAENDQWHVCRSMFKCSTETKEASANRNNREIVFTENHFRNAMGAVHSSKKTKGKNEETMRPNLIDDLIQRLELLSINNQQSALVPYKGHGTLVPFEGFEPIRRRKTRPRVDLDSESITQWNLLMGKAENEVPDTSQDKEKWWENERKVFRGRVDTFIARMHLVQGDRRFSRWKGSVVDSVIGVFLTQNVSDHLSSSAFMSLAAQFPLKTATTEITSYQTSTSAWVEEPEAQIIDPDGTITFPWGTLRQPLDKQDSTASNQYFEQSTENLIKALEVHLMEDNKGTSKDMVSSQNSSDSIILQANEDTRNGSDSEVEYQTIIPNPNQGADTFLQDPFLTRSPKKDYLSCLEKNPKLNISKNVGSGPIDLNVLSSKESLNSISDTRVTKSFFPVPTEAEATKIQGVFPVMMGAESIPVALTSSITKETETLKNNASSTEQYSAASHNVNSQPSTNINQNQGSKNFNYQTSTAMEAQRPDEAHSKQKTENVGSKMPKERRKKNHVDKQKEIDWDELRRQVLCQNRNKERGNDKMDSMDYHDMSHSDVSKISDAIRERGMNNMLAERIKAFLNRLVKDHGSIDLEWLRDAPPDKAKDYLLSIRGLGLKSVECIRLLSLHHMAFPVDTNVGRIAVRLGWVPLRPLPESLQLHLLELYPILESIQKYIWPRLCKLDQLTLYELHYQMITFGKVFCTKSRPNCNGCPMKGECRHFASAYASARLALPGPEEKGMVSSNIQFAPTEELPIIMDPLLLASSESNLNRGILHFIGNSEPFIEEPTSPEICKQETESDIEDILPEEEDDTNEIPVIEVSIEALKANVHNIMQERNLEISEGDISKALVALNPATASIPAPKLKNVSRLRTEHQVYELPDWHHLLEGMDKREPDDPSPYLLAIWTPGETADSVNPYENNCTLRGSGRLCDEKTCFHCNSVREADSQIIRGTILIPCRTAMRGSFPLNGTYFQVNEVFADHESSMNPISVPRDSIWNLRRRTVYFGTSATTIFRGMPIEEIQYCFWRGFVCVRGFDRKCRAPRPLMARLHFPASKLLAKNKKEEK